MKRIKNKEFRNKNKRIELKKARYERRQQMMEERRKKTERGEPVSERKVSMRSRRKFAVILGIIIVMLIGSWYVFKIYSLNKEYQETLAEKKNLEAEKQRLEEELENINTPEYIEQQARQQLKMIKPGEVMYILPQEEEKEE